jgi:hypothetical protein
VIRAPIGAALRSPLRASRSRADTEDTRLALLSSASAISSQVNFTRASGGMSYDDLNQIVMVGNDVPRRGPWRFVRNEVANPYALNAIAGSPGTVPTGWNVFNNAAAPRTIIGTAMIDGNAAGLDVEWAFSNFSGGGEVQFHGRSVPTTAGRGWTLAADVTLLSGSGIPVRLELEFRDAANVLLTGNSSSYVTATTEATRIVISGVAPANSAFVTVQYRVGDATSRTQVSRLRLSKPMLADGARSTFVAPAANTFGPVEYYAGQEGGEPQRINLVPDPNGVTAVDGVPGSGGQFPTNWGMGAIPGITRTIRKAVIDGVPGLIVRMEGVPGGTGACSISPLNPSRPFTGQPVSNSVSFALLTPLPATMSSMILRNNGETAATILVPQGFAGASVPLARYTNTRNPATSNLAPTIRWNFTDTTTPIVVEFFVGQWQCEEAATASPFFGAEKIGPVARYPHNGALVVEGARTNLIRNPRGEGAVTGSIVTAGSASAATGKLPDLWSLPGQGSSSVNLIGSGVEGGLPYVDLEFTCPAGSGSGVYFEANNGIPLAPSTAYTGSVYARLMGGSLAGVTCGLRTRTDSTTASNGVAVGMATLTGAPLNQQRFSIRGATPADAVAGRLNFFIGAGASDIYAVVRFAFPQVEAAEIASSPILPAVGSLAVSSRAAEVPALPLTPAQAKRGTLVGTFMLPQAAPSTSHQGLAILHNGTNGERLFLRCSVGGTAIQLLRYVGGSNTHTVNLGAAVVGVPFRAAMTWSNDTCAGAMNGGPVVTIAGGAPAVTTFQPGEADYAQTQAMFGEIGDLTLYPMRLPDAQLQSLTA